MQTTRRGMRGLSLATLVLAVGATTAAAQAQEGADLDLQAKSGRPPLVLLRQGSFFIDGKTVHTDAPVATPSPLFPPGEVTVDQMYVEFMVPQSETPQVPIILLHGCCLSGKTWETTPDGRMGWDEYFVRKGHAVYVPDQVSRARSGFNATVFNEVKQGVRPPGDLPDVIMATHEAAWGIFRFGPRFNVPFEDELFPVDAVNHLYQQMIPDLNALLPANPNPTFPNLARLARRVGGAVVVGHSESGFFPAEASLINVEGFRGMILIEGVCRATLTSQEIAKLAQIPILVVFGDHLGDVDPPYNAFWPTALEGCNTFIARVNAAGGDATMFYLPQMGIRGNSHMLMQDKNSLQLANLLRRWISRHVDVRQ
jgi:hypothetical protein